MTSFVSGAWALLTIGAWAGVLTCGAAAGAPERATPLLPGVFADPGRTTAFAADPEGHAIAIDLATGQIRWRSAQALRPLGFAGGAVIALATVADRADALRVVWLDAGDGKELRTSPTIELPDWVSVVPEPGKTFSAEVAVDGEDLLFAWRATSRYAGGAYPTEEMKARQRNDGAGAVRIDPAGALHALPPDGVAARPPALPAALADLASAQYWDGSAWRRAPIVTAGKALVLEREGQGAEQTLRLRAWDLESGEAAGGEVEGGRELLSGRHLWPQVAPGGGYLFVHEAVPPSADGEPPGWWIFALPSGERLARIPYRAGTVAATVIATVAGGDRVLTLVDAPAARPATAGADALPRILLARDPAAGETLWQVPVRGRPAPKPRR